MDAQEAIFSHQGLLKQPFTISTPTVLANSEKVLSEANQVSVTLLSCWLPSIFADVVDHQVSEALHFARRETPFGAFRTDNETTKAKREEHPKQLISRLFIDRASCKTPTRNGDTRQQFY